MLMVIFGAGATCDSCSSFPPKKEPRGCRTIGLHLRRSSFFLRSSGGCRGSMIAFRRSCQPGESGKHRRSLRRIPPQS